MNFTIGADPEFFLQKDGVFVPSIGLIGGSKEEPRIFEQGYAVLEDNVAVEFNIPPAHNHAEFIANIRHAMDHIHKELPDYHFSDESAVEFNPVDLTHPQALEFGCEPDYNAWTQDENPRPKADSLLLRSAGGHIHIGTEEDRIQVIRAMDVFVGVPSIKVDAKGLRRRALYGKAGACRFKEYGVEYRTLSNFWIWSDSMMEWVYNQTQKALQFVKDGHILTEEDGALIQHCINNSDMNAYETLVRTYKPL